MPSDFHRDMGSYLSARKRNQFFSGIKSNINNQSSLLSSKAAGHLQMLKEKLTAHPKKEGNPQGNKGVSEIEDGVHPHASVRENPPISQNAEEQDEKSSPIPPDEEKESKSPQPESLNAAEAVVKKAGSRLEKAREHLRSMAEKLHARAKLLQAKKREDEAARLSEIVQQREEQQRKETEGERRKREELEDEIKVLREKQRMEE